MIRAVFCMEGKSFVNRVLLFCFVLVYFEFTKLGDV